MSISRKLLTLALAIAGWLFFHSSARAQSFGLGASVTPSSAVLGSSLVYTINVTNLSLLDLNNVFVTNAISGSVSLIEATNSLPGTTVSTGADGIVFRMNTFFGTQVAQFTVILIPDGAGPFTNEITVANFFVPTNAATTVIANITPPVTDLAIGMTNVASAILTNDSTIIGLFVTNLGPNSASSVVVTNVLPTSFKLLSVTPSGASNSFNGGNLILNLGTMASGSRTQFQLLVQPTNAGNFPLTASVSATNVLDTNSANSVVTNFLNVIDALPSDLIVTVGSQQFNRQTGLMEMNVLLSNVGTNAAPAARITVSGLISGTWLYDAAGTNSGVPYVVYNSELAVGASVPLLLEYYVLVRSPLTNYNLSAFAVPAINLSAPTNSGVTPSITNSSGGILIEFAATPGKTYTIIYSDNSALSNALTAQPSIVAPANRVQWIDNGPPKTVSHPSNTVQRYYRVYQSP